MTFRAPDDEDSTMDRQTVRLRIDDVIATVTMENPPVNAQNRQFHEDMMVREAGEHRGPRDCAAQRSLRFAQDDMNSVITAA